MVPSHLQVLHHMQTCNTYSIVCFSSAATFWFISQDLKVLIVKIILMTVFKQVFQTTENVLVD